MKYIRHIHSSQIRSDIQHKEDILMSVGVKNNQFMRKSKCVKVRNINTLCMPISIFDQRRSEIANSEDNAYA